jgi:hypothetical protein
MDAVLAAAVGLTAFSAARLLYLDKQQADAIRQLTESFRQDPGLEELVRKSPELFKESLPGMMIPGPFSYFAIRDYRQTVGKVE